MINSIKKDGSQHQIDHYQSTDESLLENILLLMTPEQREHFLKSSSSKEIIYANRTPCFNHSLCVQLTLKAYRQLAGLFKTENQAGDMRLQNDSEAQRHIEILKADLEAGIRLSGAPVSWYRDNNDEEDIPIHIQSRLFGMQCRLQIEADGKALLRATYVKYSTDTNQSNARTENEDNGFYEIPEFDEPVDVDVLDVNETVKKTIIPVEPKTKEFLPQIKTTWHIYPPHSEDIIYFDSKAIEKFIWEITNNRLLSGVYYSAREHLRELADAVNLSQLAMQYRYELIDERETTEGHYCMLKIDGPHEDVARMTLTYVYAEEDRSDDSSENRYDNIRELLKRRMRRPVILERKEYREGLHIFGVVVGEEMPSKGFLVDVGLESQIKKQIEAMHCLAIPKSIVHLIRLATLLGNVKVFKLEPFSWKSDHIELFDELLTGCQREAIFKAINTPDICLIQGPPGTGKTRVISEIVQQASQKHWKTLLVAPTHVAVDNVLERVGYKDNISPVRCVNKDRLDSLPNHIQQFTYQQRKDSLIIHSQNKVKEDIARLNKEKMRLGNASKILQRLSPLHDNAIKLAAKERSLEKQLSLVEKHVQKGFSAELKNIIRIKHDREAFLCDSRKEFDDSTKALEALRVRMKQFRAGTYTKKDKERFKLAQSNVDKTQGKALKDIRGRHGKTEDTIYSIKTEIEATDAKYRDTKNVLCQLDEGLIPDEVRKAIQEALLLTAAEHDRNINKELKELKEARDRLTINREENNRLGTVIEGIKEKQAKLDQGIAEPWWSKTFSLVWWQSRLIDFEERRLRYNLQLQDSLALITGLQLEIDKAQALFENSKVAKKKALIEIEKSKRIERHTWYRSRHNILIVELNLLKGQLHEENSNLTILWHEVEHAQDNFDQASKQALESSKKQIRQELVSEARKIRKDIYICKEKVESAANLALESKRDLERLRDKIVKAIKQNEEDIDISINSLKRQITANSDQFEHLKKQATLFLGENPPDKPSEIKVVLKKVATQIDRNGYLTSFSESWLDCLHRNSDDLSSRLAKYVNLVCATTIGIASDEYFGDGKPLEQKQFDLLIIDEAGKVTEPQFLVAATRAKKWVIVGDHKQLPPYYDRKLDRIFSKVNRLRKRNDLPRFDTAALQISYFENLWNQLSSSKAESEKAKARIVTLDVQRRMHPDLAEFISDMFYPNEYNSPDDADFVKEKTLDLPSFKYAITFIEVVPPQRAKGLESNLRFESEQETLKLSCKAGYANLSEAEKVIEVLDSLLGEESLFAEQDKLDSNNESAAAIGITSFYAGQVELIRRLIKEKDSLDAQEVSSNSQFLCKGKIKVAVNTVDSFQGKECSVIILSFTRSNLYQNIGFVDDANRLNVAMSRAKKKLILLGDTKTFTNRSHAKDINVKGNVSSSICTERLFFEKLVEYIEGRGEIKKAFHVWRTENDTACANQ